MIGWAVRLAVWLGMQSIMVCNDCEVALAQVLALRVCCHLQHQQSVLRLIAGVLWESGVVPRLVWVPSELQPGDPMSRVNSVFAGSQTKAESQAWEV